MSLPIQVGDYATVMVDGLGYPLRITKADASEIRVGEFQIIQTPQGWKIKNYGRPHEIIFHHPTALEELRELWLRGGLSKEEIENWIRKLWPNRATYENKTLYEIVTDHAKFIEGEYGWDNEDYPQPMEFYMLYNLRDGELEFYPLQEIGQRLAARPDYLLLYAK